MFNSLGKLVVSVSEFYKDLNPSTLSGAIDVIAVERSDGSLACSPFHVRFGKMQLLRPQEQVVEVKVNGKVVEDVQMKLGEAGEAFFVMEADGDVPIELRTSPVSKPDYKLGANMVSFAISQSFIL
jgi:phosphatidate phosphatase LPIN